jgi:leucyl/phenylalanyl-tRNA--protein transferase
MPVEPPPSAYDFSLGGADPGEDLVGVGGDLRPGTILAAYRTGLFPMGLGDDGQPPLGWWSPDPRGVLPRGALRVSASLRKSCRRFEIRVDTGFAEVVAACADPARDGRWITPQIAEAYVELHRLGWAHSVEAWRDGRLAGGLYGLSIGGLFAGESMFHRERDASKVALVALDSIVYGPGAPDGRLIDVQWRTAHLGRLGVVEVAREKYLTMLERALSLGPIAFG